MSPKRDPADGQQLRLGTITRLSTPGQARGHGRARQEELEIRAYAEELGATIVDTWQIEERATIFDRPQFQAVLDRAAEMKRQGLMDGVILASVDRLSRDPYDGGAVCRDALLNGLRLFFAAERLDASRVEDQERVIGALQAARAYVERLKRQTIPARQARAGDGKIPNGQVRWPFAYSSKTGKATPEPQRVDVVRQWARMLIAGSTLAEIAAWMESQGIPSPKGARRWGRSTLTRILRDPALKGEFYAFGERMVADHFYEPAKRQANTPTLVCRDKANAILDDATWQAVQDRLETNKVFCRRNLKYGYGPLHRLVRCGVCSRAFGVTDAHKGPASAAFRCPVCKRRVNAWGLWRDVKADLIEVFSNPAYLAERLRRQVLDGVSASMVGRQIEKCQAQLQAIDEQEGRALRMAISLPAYLEKKLDAEIGRLRRRREALEAKLSERQETLARLGEAEWTSDQLVTLWQCMVKDASDGEWRRFLRAINFRVEFGPDRVSYRFETQVFSRAEVDCITQALPDGWSSQVKYVFPPS
jgi:site-specific DNA recombinase